MVNPVDIDHFRVPETNSQVFSLLFNLETCLRELIIETLSSRLGPEWLRSIPKDIQDKCAKGRLYERTNNWTSYVEHHPLYYVDFSDLAKTINSLWPQHFAAIFADKSVLTASLRQLEPIRNKVAHNRRATPADVNIVEGVVASLRSALGESRFRSLASKCSDAPQVTDVLTELAVEVATAGATMKNLAEAEPLTVWPTVCGKWWFDNDYLLGPDDKSKLELLTLRQETLQGELSYVQQQIEGMQRASKTRPPPVPDEPNPIQAIVDLFTLYDQYRSLPRARGMGHVLEKWVRDHDVDTALRSAVDAITSLSERIPNV